MRTLPLTSDQLRQAFASYEVFNTAAFLDAETGQVHDIAEDLIDYCRGNIEGTDLQLSDSHDLPTAQAVAEELDALESGFDEDGLPFEPDDRRYFPLPRLGGAPEQEIDAQIKEWLAHHQLQPQ